MSDYCTCSLIRYVTIVSNLSLVESGRQSTFLFHRGTFKVIYYLLVNEGLLHHWPPKIILFFHHQNPKLHDHFAHITNFNVANTCMWTFLTNLELINGPRWCNANYMSFPLLFGFKWFSTTFPGLENIISDFHDFPGFPWPAGNG